VSKLGESPGGSLQQFAGAGLAALHPGPDGPGRQTPALVRQPDNHLLLKSDIHARRPGIAADAAILVTPSFFLEADIGAAILHLAPFAATAGIDLELGSALAHPLIDLLGEGVERQVFEGNVGIFMTGHWRTPRHPALLIELT